MGTTVGIISIKGGVGKTTIASSLAVDLAQSYSKKVLVADANFSAPNLGIHMDILSPEKSIHEVMAGKAHFKEAIHTKFGVDILPGSYRQHQGMNVLKLKDKLATLKEDYDFIVLDSSPSLNEEVLSTILASDVLFVVSTPDFPTLSCSLRAAKLAKQRGKPIAGMIINKIRDPSYELSLKDLEETTGIPVVARIPDEKVNVRALFSRMPVTAYDKRSNFSKEVHKLSSVLAMEKEPPSFFARLFSKDLRKEHVNRALLRDSFYTSVFTPATPELEEEKVPEVNEVKSESKVDVKVEAKK